MAVSDGRKIGADGRSKTPVGSTVDVPNATYRNSIGDALMTAYWKDPDFDPKQSAFYYVRVIEIPTPRWTAYDAKRFWRDDVEGSPDDTPGARLYLADLVHARVRRKIKIRRAACFRRR